MRKSRLMEAGLPRYYIPIDQGIPLSLSVDTHAINHPRLRRVHEITSLRGSSSQPSDAKPPEKEFGRMAQRPGVSLSTCRGSYTSGIYMNLL